MRLRKARRGWCWIQDCRRHCPDPAHSAASRRGEAVPRFDVGTDHGASAAGRLRRRRTTKTKSRRIPIKTALQKRAPCMASMVIEKSRSVPSPKTSSAKNVRRTAPTSKTTARITSPRVKQRACVDRDSAITSYPIHPSAQQVVPCRPSGPSGDHMPASSPSAGDTLHP